MSSKVDRELAQIEARRTETEAQGPVPKKGIGPTLKRWAKDAMLRRHSTK